MKKRETVGGERERKRNRRVGKMAMNKYLSIVTLNVNGINAPIKRQTDKEVVPIYNRILLGHKKNEILPVATTWQDLEGSMLSEISQIEKDNHHMISLICGIQKPK